MLTYFGFMRGEAVGIGDRLATPPVALAHAVVAAVLLALAKSESITISHSETPIDAPAE